jgi:hypothetical protein
MLEPGSKVNWSSEAHNLLGSVKALPNLYKKTQHFYDVAIVLDTLSPDIHSGNNTSHSGIIVIRYYNVLYLSIMCMCML